MKVYLMLLLGLLLTGSAFAKSSDDGLAAYLRIQEALANDSMTEVSVAALDLIKNTKDGKLQKSAEGMRKNISIEDARAHFKELSALMTNWAETAKPMGIDRVICPMAHASWLQRSGPIRNPYYGKQMLECGEVQK
ncbi:hypothetical protein WDW37_09085 [Bdellovibrionota bacterium FG-1]